MKKEKTKTEIMCELDYDLWINLLNHGSYEEVGKEVIRLLMSAETNELNSRKIIICGS